MRKFFNRLLNSTDHPHYKTIVLLMWRMLLAGVMLVLLIFLILSFTKLPSVAELENPRSNQASQVLCDDGTVLGKYYTENRVPVEYKDLSPHLVNALIATEDKRFRDHPGIDFVSAVRAIVFLGSRGGGSTITQQLAKQLFTVQVSSNVAERIIQKLKEWIIAVQLERRYTKEEIIALYLNRYDFINGAQGIRAASEIYFNTHPKDLAIQDAATLVGMLKNSSLYNPISRPDMVLQRRSVVLKQMVVSGFITEAEYRRLIRKPLGLRFTRQTHTDGLAPYMRMELAKQLRQLLSQPEYRKPDGTMYDLYRDGLRIYTSINADMQRIAEEEMEKHMAQLQRVFFTHWKGRDPWTYDNASSTTKVPVERRELEFMLYLRSSERYQKLRIEYLAGIITALEAETGVRFHEDDREIERILREKEKPGHFNRLIKAKLISEELADRYRRVLQSNSLPTLERQWAALQSAVKNSFNKPVPMQVFAYNDRHYVDTIMSPRDSLKYLSMFLQTGIMAVEPSSGEVKVWVGGINHEWFQYDHVNRETRRQVGSTFKPFVYATAIAMQGLSPCFEVIDRPVTISPGEGEFGLIKSWTPRNADGDYSGNSYTLFEALNKSVNTVSAYLMKELGSPEPVRTLAAQMGIDKSVLPSSPSICLGSVDLSVEEMTGAYATFVNNGIYVRPALLLRVEDRFGNIIYESIPEENLALSPAYNYTMVNMLEKALTNRGKVQGPVGGKTGTTNDYADGWFMGITPELVVGTWVGGDKRWIAFRDLAYGQGSRMARPFFLSFIERLQNDPKINWDKTATFYKPPGELGIELDCNAYRGALNSDDAFERRIDNQPDFD